MTQKSDAVPPPEGVPQPVEMQAAQKQAETNAGVARATGVVAGGNIASRILGLGREIVLTNLFGASAAVDAFNIAVIVPKAFYDLLIGGHVNSALVPVLSESASKDDRTDLWALVSVLVSFVSVVVLGLVMLLLVFAPQVVQLVAGDRSTETLRIAAELLRLTAPALFFLSLFAVLSGTLYAVRSFTWPAFAGAVFNAAIVLVTLAAAPTIGIAAAALGWLIGAILQFALQLPGLRGARLRFTLNWNHAGLRQIALLYAPVMFSLIIDTLVIRLFSYRLANSVGVGSISYMNWSTTLIQFPHGLVATAISVAILPTLSRQATLMLGNAAEKASSAAEFRDTLGLGLRLATVLILPATIGLFVMATPIVDLLFEHGEFTAPDTVITVMALRLYLIGLPFAALDLLLIYAFYAQQDTLTPALVGLLSLAVYMVVAILLMPTYQLYSLMIADSIKHALHACLSAYLLMRRLKGLGGQKLPMTFIKALAASVLMGLVGWLILPMLSPLAQYGDWGEAALVLVSGGICAAVFVGAAFILRVDELRWLVGLVRAKVAR